MLWLPLPSSRYPFSPAPQNKRLFAAFGTDLKTKNLAQGEFNPSLPLVDARSPSSFVIESSLLTTCSLYATLDRAVIWLVVALPQRTAIPVHCCTAAAAY